MIQIIVIDSEFLRLSNVNTLRKKNMIDMIFKKKKQPKKPTENKNKRKPHGFNIRTLCLSYIDW